MIMQSLHESLFLDTSWICRKTIILSEHLTSEYQSSSLRHWNSRSFKNERSN